MAIIGVDIEIEEYLDRVSKRALINELLSRGVRCYDTDKEVDISRSDFADDRAVREFLFDFMGIQPWKGRRELLTAIDELFEL